MKCGHLHPSDATSASSKRPGKSQVIFEMEDSIVWTAERLESKNEWYDSRGDILGRRCCINVVVGLMTSQTVKTK